MRSVITMSDLQRADAVTPFPPYGADQVALMQCLRLALEQHNKHASGRWQVDDASSYQDGALLTAVTSEHKRPAVGVLVSRFGNLVTPFRMGASPEQPLIEEIENIIARVQTECGCRYAPAALLNQPYSGLMTKYRVGTWFQRFFCDVYWTAAKPHEGLIEWP